MKNYDEFIKGLQEEVEVPEKVWKKFRDTLDELPDTHVSGRKRGRKWIAAAASAAAVLALGTGFCYANPVLAAKIPIIGRIFQQVESDLTFSGDYDGKVETLTQEQAEYTTRDQGVEIAASEIYSDGYSVFVTAQITVEQGGLSNIPEHYTGGDSDGDETVSRTMYTQGEWSVGSKAAGQALMNNNFEGKILDDNTFIGMMKLNLEDITGGSDILELQLTQIGYDDINELDSEDISASHKIDGNWNLSIPFNVDTENAKEIAVGQKTEKGFGVNRVFVSPYQVVVYMDVPYTTLSEDEFTREDFDEMWAAKTEGMENPGDPPFTYEEYLQKKIYDYGEIAVFNQDGEALAFDASTQDSCVLAVQGLTIETLHIFLSDDEENAHALIQSQSMEEARENSDQEVTVEVQ